MRISELIFALEQLKAEHGDREVETMDYGWRRVPARMPVVAYRKIRNRREGREKFWDEYQGETWKGEKVVRI